MKVYAYWNRKDLDCKKIFHFMSPNDSFSVVPYLKEKNELRIERICQQYDNKSNIIEEIQKNELIIFLTHGTEEQILKYRNIPDQEFTECILLDVENANILKDKIVLAFCCSSAKCLGRYCVLPEVGCKAFVGFERDIVYDNGNAIKSRHLIYESYKIAFMKSLKYAALRKCTVEEFCIKLVQFMRKEAMKAILQAENHSLHNMYSGTIESVIALGDTQQKIFF